MKTFYIKGDFIHADRPDHLSEQPDCCLLVREGRCAGFFAQSEAGIPVRDYSGSLIIPAFTDLHVHAAQFPNMGLGMDMPLLPWLERYTFPLEAAYQDPEYANLVYSRFVRELWRNGSLRSCVYSTVHQEATAILMDLFLESGLAAFVGKINMDRNAPEALTETTEESLAETRRWLEQYAGVSPKVKPIITPRFVPSVTEALMDGLGELAREFNVPVQSHLNENRDEVEWVKQLHPESDNYLDVYGDHGLIRDQATIMAHCIHNVPEEVARFARDEVFVAHCPTANLNMSSGIMPAARLLRQGNIHLALGTDVAGGNTLSIPRVMVAAMQSSNVLFSQDPAQTPLSLAEAFWMGTRGGGKFFGDCGDFREGSSCDLLVIDDSAARRIKAMSLTDRLSRFVFAGDPAEIRWRMLEGEILPEPRLRE
ncbi:MAG: amidohydrolase family protein [Clostridiaceae bacterium]